jgi:phosphoribosylformylglycinamidine synthase
VGLVDDLTTPPPGIGLVEGTLLVLLGPDEATLSGSRWAWDRGHRGGAPPALDLDAHAATCALVRDLVASELALGVHDVGEGGLGLALAEMAVASGVGFRVAPPEGTTAPGHAWLFGESPGRFVLAIDRAAVGEVHRRHVKVGVRARVLGDAGGDRMVVDGLLDGLLDVPLAEATAAWRGRLPDLLGHGTTQG